jgi:hypothetical protein
MIVTFIGRPIGSSGLSRVLSHDAPERLTDDQLREYLSRVYQDVCFVKPCLPELYEAVLVTCYGRYTAETILKGVIR